MDLGPESSSPICLLFKGIERVHPGKKQTWEDTIHIIQTLQGWGKGFLWFMKAWLKMYSLNQAGNFQSLAPTVQISSVWPDVRSLEILWGNATELSCGHGAACIMAPETEQVSAASKEEAFPGRAAPRGAELPHPWGSASSCWLLSIKGATGGILTLGRN